MILHRFFLANDLLKVLEKEKITGFAGMNPIWVKLFNEKRGLPKEYDFSSLRYITNSGGKVPEAIVKKMRVLFPQTQIYLMYGLTEAFRSTYLPPEEIDRRPNSIGKAIPNVEILVLNDKGEECKPGEVGELVHRGALITRGYWNDPEKTRGAFVDNPLLPGREDRLYRTGDLALRREDGIFEFLGRNDEQVKYMGYRIATSDVEAALIAIAGVSEAAVFLDDSESLVAPELVALVQCEPGCEVAEIGKDLALRLPQYMVPKRILAVASIPRTDRGKVARQQLRAFVAGRPT